MDTIKTYRRFRKSTLRDLYERILWLKELCEEFPSDNPETIKKREEGIADRKREFRAYAHKNTDRLAKSLREAPRGIADDWGDYTTFGFLDDDAVTATDDEIREYLDDTYRVELWCPDGNPDGAGNEFTSRLEFYRTPCGVAFIHCKSLNI